MPTSFIPRSFETASISPAYETFRRLIKNLVESWLQAKGDFSVWRRQTPQLLRTLEWALSIRAERLLSGTSSKIAVACEVVPRCIKRLPAGRAGKAQARFDACLLFKDLVSSPLPQILPHILGRCGRERCHRYFLNLTRRKRRYCLRACALAESAHRAQKTKHAREEREKLTRAHSLIREFTRARSDGDWKTWVVTQNLKRAFTTEVQLTKNWLTRMINQGQLEAPDK